MTPHKRYLVVLRHAQREDEVHNGWAAAEAARAGGRPWDPPLSAHGRTQAEDAALKLAAWERHTGARIVAVVASPFLRCLQTAAAVCRRLGLLQLHISWAVSEALCRAGPVPAGPLPDWMWPREDVEGDVQQGGSCSGDGRPSTARQGLRPEEFLAHLGATFAAPSPLTGSGLLVAGAQLLPPYTSTSHGDLAVQARLQGRARVEQEEGPDGGAMEAAEGPSRADEQSQTDIGPILQGLHVTVLPPPSGPAAPASGVATPGGTTAAAPALEDDGASDSLSFASAESTDEDGEVAGTTCCGLDAQAPQSSSPGWSLARQARGDGVGSMSAGQQEQPQDGHHASRIEKHLPGDDEQGGCTSSVTTVSTTAPLLPTCTVPCSPETLEAAHARYRAALRCIIAAATVTAATPITGSSAKGVAAASCITGLGSSQQAGPLRLMSGCATLCGAQGVLLEPWCALWQAGMMRRGNGVQMSTAAGGHRSSAGGSDGGKPPSTMTATVETKEGLPGDGPECRLGTAGAAADEEYDARQLMRQPISQQLDTPLHDSSAAGALGHSMRQHHHHHQSENRERDGEVEAVLVVTHGEAVACAAATVAPWALVYEVRHTGFVVLAAGEGAGDIGVDAEWEREWELLPDPLGDRGVLWMSALDD